MYSLTFQFTYNYHSHFIRYISWYSGAIVVVWQLDLQLPLESMPITTNVASSIQHYVIKFVSDLRQVCGFLLLLRFPPPIKTDCHNITEILLKVASNTMTLTEMYLCEFSQIICITKMYIYIPVCLAERKCEPGVGNDSSHIIDRY